MRYLIDGYNLLYAIGRVSPRSPRSAVDQARRWLVQQLSQDVQRDVTVVFDGHPPRNADPAGVVRVLYSRQDSADDVIEELVRTDPTPKQLAVVSNDHRLQQAGRRRGCQVVACLDYFEARPPPPPAKAEPPKPAEPTAEETERWLKEFGDLEDEDPVLRDPY